MENNAIKNNAKESQLLEIITSKGNEIKKNRPCKPQRRPKSAKNL